MTTTSKNDPYKVDSLFGWVMLGGFGVALGAVYVTNLTPYSDFVFNFLFGERRAAAVLMNLPFIGSWIENTGLSLATLIAACVFGAVQVGEVWGLLLVLRGRHKVKRGQLFAALILSLLCFAVDLVAVLNFFPPVSVPLGRFLRAGSLSQILWGELIIGGIILFGGCIYAWLWQLVRRVM